MDSWSSSLPLDDEFQKLVIRMNPPRVTVDNNSSRTTTLIKVDSANKRGSLLGVVQVLTDMNLIIRRAYISSDGEWFMDVFHVIDQNGNKLLQDDVAERIQQEYYIRHVDGCPINCQAERQRVIHCLEAAIRRRNSEGIQLELCGEDRVGLLSDVTRIFRENGLSVTRAEITTRGSQAMNVFYVTDASGNPVKSETIEAVRNEIGLTILHVKDDVCSNTPSQEKGILSLCNLFRTSSEKFLYNLGLLKSCS